MIWPTYQRPPSGPNWPTLPHFPPNQLATKETMNADPWRQTRAHLLPNLSQKPATNKRQKSGNEKQPPTKGSTWGLTGQFFPVFTPPQWAAKETLNAEPWYQTSADHLSTDLPLTKRPQLTNEQQRAIGKEWYPTTWHYVCVPIANGQEPMTNLAHVQTRNKLPDKESNRYLVV